MAVKSSNREKNLAERPLKASCEYERKNQITFQFVLGAVVVAINQLQVGFTITYTNVSQRLVDEYFEVIANASSENDVSAGDQRMLWSLIISIINFGACVGSLVAGPCADKFGRKKFLWWLNFCSILSSILFMTSTIKPVIFSGSPFILMASRIVIGFSLGASITAVGLYLVEISPKNIRGFLGLLPTTSRYLGGFIEQCFGHYKVFGNLLAWHWIALFGFGTALVQAVAIPFCPPSPRYLLIFAGNEGKARNALKKLRRSDDIEDEIDEMQSEHRVEKSRPKFSVLQFFKSPELRRPFLLVTGLHIAQQFSGVSMVINYTQVIFSQAGLTPSDASFGSIGVAGLMATSAFMSMWAVDRVGRRKVVIIGYLGMAVSYVLFTLTFVLKVPEGNESLEKLRTSGAVIALLLVMMFASSGPSPVTYFIASELFTQGPRPLALGIGFFVNRLGGFCLLFLFPHVQALLGDYTFVSFVAVCLCNLLVVYFFLPETKKRTFEDIAKGFSKDDTSENGNENNAVCNGTVPLTDRSAGALPNTHQVFMFETQV